MDATLTELVDARLAGVRQKPAPLGSYILSRYFIFLEAERQEFKARVPVSLVCPPMLYLPEERPLLEWKVPPPPIHLLNRQVLPFFLAPGCGDTAAHNEAMANLLWTGLDWQVHFPEQAATVAGVQTHEPLPPGAVVQIHSHGRMRSFWSATDNADEQGFLIYAVVGRIDTDTPTIQLRVGINGCWCPLRLNHVFTC